ncbi:MAG: hypothetical protein SGJ00_04005 [bacterium]|nr:hypothetical protein [bacterium]
MKQFLLSTFTVHKLRRLVIGETIGKFFAFMIGLSSAKLFTYKVIEQKGLKNLFGLLPRKQIVMHRVPHWVELLFAAIIGFIVMEIFYYFFLQINTVWVWRKCLRGFVYLKRGFAYLKLIITQATVQP